MKLTNLFESHPEWKQDAHDDFEVLAGSMIKQGYKHNEYLMDDGMAYTTRGWLTTDRWTVHDGLVRSKECGAEISMSLTRQNTFTVSNGVGTDRGSYPVWRFEPYFFSEDVDYTPAAATALVKKALAFNKEKLIPWLKSEPTLNLQVQTRSKP
jgi:hypothetical protein